MNVPSIMVNGSKMYLATPIARKLGYSDASTYLKKYVSDCNRKLIKCSEMNIQGPKAWVVNYKGIEQLIDHSHVSIQEKSKIKRMFMDSKFQTIEQAIVSRPEVIIELAKKIQTIKDDNYRLNVINNDINNLLRECDELLKQVKS